MENNRIKAAYQLIRIARELIEESGSCHGDDLFVDENMAKTDDAMKHLTESEHALKGYPDIGCVPPELTSRYAELRIAVLHAIDMYADPDETFAQFEAFWKAWTTTVGRKRDCKTEYEVFRKHKDYVAVAPLLLPQLEHEKAWRGSMKTQGRFVPGMPHMKTWLRQRHWENQLEDAVPAQSNNNNNNFTNYNNEQEYTEL